MSLHDVPIGVIAKHDERTDDTDSDGLSLDDTMVMTVTLSSCLGDATLELVLFHFVENLLYMLLKATRALATSDPRAVLDDMTSCGQLRLSACPQCSQATQDVLSISLAARGDNS